MNAATTSDATTTPDVAVAPAGKVVFLAAGGTGGHVFPALALAQKLKKDGLQPMLLTDKRFFKLQTIHQQFRESDIPILTIPAASLSGNLLCKLMAIPVILSGIRMARKLCAEHEPKLMVGFGGYPSFPAVYGAAKAGVRIVLHEQNAHMGRANRKLAGFAKCIATSFSETAGIPLSCQSKVICTGNPVRESISAVGQLPYSPPEAGSPLRILVIGGSLGASIFSDSLPKALAAIPEDLHSQITITQQCRPAELEQVRQVYKDLHILAELKPFFDDMPEKLAAAHLVIARAGASTVCELLAARRPAILVPYPHAMDDHQTANARFFVQTGGGWMVKQEHFTPQDVAFQLIQLLNHPEKITEKATALAMLPNHKPTETLAALVTTLIGR